MPTYALTLLRSTLQRRAVLLALPLALMAGGCDRGVTDPDHSDAIPAELELYDRGTGDLLATLHGSGSAAHWDGSLPPLAPGEELAVNTVFLDQDGNEIELGGEYSVNAMLAEGSPEGVVELTPHGDHVDIEGISEGEVEVDFFLWHGSHSDWDAPASLPVVVQAAG